jgi:hypothetical protein
MMDEWTKFGERVSIALNRRRMHLFDQASGVNLRGIA